MIGKGPSEKERKIKNGKNVVRNTIIYKYTTHTTYTHTCINTTHHLSKNRKLNALKRIGWWKKNIAADKNHQSCWRHLHSRFLKLKLKLIRTPCHHHLKNIFNHNDDDDFFARYLSLPLLGNIVFWCFFFIMHQKNIPWYCINASIPWHLMKLIHF